MGGFYGSVQFRTADRGRVLAAAEAVARAAGIKCLVGPALNGWIGVYPEGHGQEHTVGEQLAGIVGGHAMHLLVHDDDVLAYWLWNDGRLVDRYWSAPGYFGEESRVEEEPLVGDLERFEFVLDAAGRAELRQLLGRDDGSPFEYERLDAVGKLLGIRNPTTAYEYLKEGGTDGVTGWPRRFAEVPVSRVASDRRRRAAEAKRIAAERTRLRAAGVLLLSRDRAEGAPVGCGAAGGFVAVTPGYANAGGVTTVEYQCDPWDEPTAPAGLDLPTNPHVTGLSSDATGRRLAMAAGSCVKVWDWAGDRWRSLTEVPERDLTIAVALSADGSRVAHLSRTELVVTDLTTGQPIVGAVPAAGIRAVAFHPGGDWVVAAGGRLRLCRLSDSYAEREVFVGGARQSSHWIDTVPGAQAQVEMFGRALAELATPGSRDKFAPAPDDVEQTRRQFEQSMAEARERLQWLGRDGPPRVPAETCMTAGFDPSGRWLWAGTDAGLRVYDWPALVGAPRDEPPAPTFAATLPPLPQTDRVWLAGAYVYAVAAEPTGGGLVFGGMGDGLFRLDLSSGVVRRIGSTPGGGHVVALVFDHARAKLAVRSHAWSLDDPRNRRAQRWAWEVFDYARLLAGS